jgi:hypothetical protein
MKKIFSWKDFLNESEYCKGLSLNVDLFWDDEDDTEFLKAKNYKNIKKELYIGAELASMKIIDHRLTEYGDKNPDYGFTYLYVISQRKLRSFQLL